MYRGREDAIEKATEFGPKLLPLIRGHKSRSVMTETASGPHDGLGYKPTPATCQPESRVNKSMPVIFS
jgi:hypothetical protein